MKKRFCSVIALLLTLAPGLSMAAEQKQLSREEQDASAFEAMFPKGTPLEKDVYRADQLLISATGSLKPVRLAPSVATVITAEQIEKIGARTLSEVLETVPGLHVGVSNKNQTDPVYSIRGIHTSLNPQILILVNGIKINREFTGGLPFGFQMPMTMVSRVEVVRGPGSAVYGADAFAGVINVITKDGKEIDGLQGGARYGSFDSVDGWIQYGDAFNGWDVALSLDYMSSLGDTDRIIDTDLQGTLDQAMDTNASQAPGALPTEYKLLDAQLAISKDAWTARFWGLQQNNADMKDGVTQTLSTKNSLDTAVYRAELRFDNRTMVKKSGMTANLSLQYTKTDPYYQLFPDNAVMPIGANGNIDFVTPTGVTYFPDGVIGNPIAPEYRTILESAYYYDGWQQQLWRLAVGMTYLYTETSEKKNFGPGVLDQSPTPSLSTGTLTEIQNDALLFMENQYRTLYFSSAQDEWAFARGWELTGGIRYDHYSDFGDTINPRAALVWETTTELTSKLIYGRAFRAPAFVDLYTKNNPSNLGNPDLEPETISTYELAFNWEPTENLTLGTNFFYYDIDGLIELVQDPGQTTLTAQNAKDQEGYGFELESSWQPITTLQIKGNLAYQHSEDKATGERIADAPGLQFYANVNWEFTPTWFIDGQWFWIGDRERAVGDLRQEIDDYNLVNLSVRKKELFKHWEVALAARNLFDQDVREPSQTVIRGDYPMEGRALWAEVRFHY